MKQFYLVLLFTFSFFNAMANNDSLFPSATINCRTTVCKNASNPLLTFTGTSGAAPYTFIYTINGGGNLTVTTTTGNNITVSIRYLNPFVIQTLNLDIYYTEYTNKKIIPLHSNCRPNC